VLAVGAVVAALATAAVAPAPREPRRFSLGDLANVVTISAPQISPDGRRAVALIGRIDTAQNRSADAIDIIDIATTARRTLVDGRTGLEAPKWSPEGGRIAFIADSGSAEGPRPQVFVSALDGSPPKRVTSAPEGVIQFAWRPDGRALAYVGVDPPPKRRGAARFVDAYEVGNGSNLLPGAARPFRVWLQPLDAARATVLTPGAGSVTNGEDLSTLSFTPDGSALAYLWAPDAILNDQDFAAVHIIDLARRTEHPLTPHGVRQRDPLFSPDGNQVAYLASDGDPQTHAIDVFVAARAGGAGNNLSLPIDQYVHDAAWQPAGGALYFRSTSGTHTAIWRARAGDRPQRIDVAGLCSSSPLAGAIAKDGTLLFVGSATGRLPELYVNPPGGPPRKISDYNRVVAKRTFGSSERVTFPTSTGIPGDGVLIEPPGFRPQRKYPLVVLIHGGPTDAATESFSSDNFDDLTQLMAARGWLVLEPNYRGSYNVGRAYLGAIFNDVSTGPGRDVMAAVKAVQARGIVDPARIAVSGWSYGGVMTTWMITHEHLWRAAVAGAAVTDWIADYAIADDLNEDLDLFRGSPFIKRNRARWVHEESITYVADVTTRLGQAGAIRRVSDRRPLSARPGAHGRRVRALDELHRRSF
jgi:dipeptidyl aminopeptidase/acylaminoacyl peptidase